MEQGKQLGHQKQLVLSCQMNSKACNVIPPRQSANYKPNIWKYDFIQSLHSKYKVQLIYTQLYCMGLIVLNLLVLLNFLLVF